MGARNIVKVLDEYNYSVFTKGWLKPLTRGGTDDLDNLVTACWPCNARKGDFALQEFGREPRPPAATNWDGLSSHFPAFWAAAGQPAAMRPWVSALALDPSLPLPLRQ